jgi:hypothetical protein
MVWLDADHYIERVEYEGEPAGINESHRRPDGAWCRGWVPFKGSKWETQFRANPIQSWEVVQQEPLTLTPSIACRVCGSHGHITDGKWVPA